MNGTDLADPVESSDQDSPPSIDDFHQWKDQKDSPDLLHLENVKPNFDAPAAAPQNGTRVIGGKTYKVVGAVPAEQSPALKPVGTISDNDLDPSKIVDHDPDFAYSLFKKQHENDQVTPFDVVSAPTKFIWGAAKGFATGLPSFLKSGFHTIENIGVGADSAASEDQKTKAANELMGGALSGTADAADLLHGLKRNASAFSSLITGRLIGSRDKEMSKDDVVALLKQQAVSRNIKEAVQRGDMREALKYAGLPDSIADKAYTPEELKKVGYSGERAQELGMTLNPINYLPFGKLIPEGLGGALLSQTGKAMRYSGSVLDNPFVRWSTHYSPVYAGVAAASGHWQPAVAFGLSKGVPAIGRALKSGGQLSEEAGMGINAPEEAAMLSDFRKLGGEPEGIVRQGAKKALQAGAVGGTQLLPFTLGAQSPEQAGEMFGFGAGAGMFGLGMREAWKNGVFHLSGGKPLNLSSESRTYGTPDDALHAQATANMSKEDVFQVNRERHGMQAVGRLFILPEDVFDQRAGNAKGAGFVVDTGGDVPTIYYRGEAGFQQARAHEPVHLVSDTLNPEQKAEIYTGLQKKNDMSEYATKYYSDLYKEPIKVDFDSLPDKEPNPGDKYGMTKEKIMEEMLADMLSKGKSFSDITQNPDILRSLQVGAGKLAEHLGMPLTANETSQVRGVNPSYSAISTIELAMRKLAKDAARSGPTYGQAIPDPESYFQDLRNGLRGMGYKAGEATILSEDVIDEAKDQNKIVGLDDLFRRAMTGKWPDLKIAASPSQTTTEPTAPIPQQPVAPQPIVPAQAEQGATAQPQPESSTSVAPQPSKIVGPVLITPQGVEKGMVGETHADLMKKAVSKGNESAIDALGDEANHAFHDTNGELHDREAAAKIAVAANQVPHDVTSLQSEHLIQNERPIPVEHGEFAKEGYTAEAPKSFAEFAASHSPFADALTKEEITELHRQMESGKITNQDSLNRYLEQRMEGQRGEALRALKTVQDNQQPFEATFVKTDGSLRTGQFQFGKREGLKGGKKSTAGNPDLYTVYDLDAKGYRTFDINRLQRIQGEGVDYRYSKKYMPGEQEEISSRVKKQKENDELLRRESLWQRLMSAPRDKVTGIAEDISPEDSQWIIQRLDAAPGDNPTVRAALSKKFMPREEPKETQFSEKLVSPAIRVNDLQFTGATIEEAKAKARAFGLSPDEIKQGEQGFVTNKGVWKTPDQAGEFTSERRQMGKQQSEGPLSVQAFNRWRRYMPSEGQKPIEQLTPEEWASDPRYDEAINEIKRYASYQMGKKQSGMKNFQDVDPIEEHKRSIEEAIKSGRPYSKEAAAAYGIEGADQQWRVNVNTDDKKNVVKIVSATSEKQALVEAEKLPDVRFVHKDTVRQFMPADETPELVNLGNGLTPEENKRYLEIKANPEPTTQEADEFSALIDKINAHTEGEGSSRYRDSEGLRKFMPSVKAQTETPEFKRWFGKSKVVDESGTPIVVFHGTQRPDRIGSRFKKSRATSGPMSFFTDDPEIASGYAKGKADTSLEAPEHYAGWFKIKPEGSRSEMTIDRAWYHLSPEQRSEITKKLYTTGYENADEGEGAIVNNSSSIMGDQSIDWELKEAHGNALKAATEIWLTSGHLFNSEENFLDVLKALGVKGARLDDPHAAKSAVYPVYLSIKNPFDTSNIPQNVIDTLKQSAKRRRGSQYGADQWDKNTVSGKDWIERIEGDQKEGTTHAWTSIPDWATEALQNLGYDGIRDRGGKYGGDKHNVWIPFDETQIKSAIGNRGTFDPENKNISFMPSTKPFYSQLERTIESQPDKASPEQLRAAILKGPGVKQAELRETKDQLGTSFDQWLKDNPRATKSEILDFVRENQVQVKEIEKGRDVAVTGDDAVKQWWNDRTPAPSQQWENLTQTARDQVREQYADERGEPGNNFTSQIAEQYVNRGYSQEEADQMAEELEGMPRAERNAAIERQGLNVTPEGWSFVGGGTKFDQYQLAGSIPGSYRETLATLPQKTSQAPVVEKGPMGQWQVTYPDGNFEGGYATEEEARRAAIAFNRSSEHGIEAPLFHSSHWDEPNVVLHIRSNERETPNGKMLFLEELQSDWAQKGRREGFGKQKTHPVGWASTEDTTGMTGVPDLPFKSNWKTLGLKIALRKAAETGASELGWTTGDIQNERYDLSKQVRGIEWYWNDKKAGTKIVRITPNEGNVIELGINKDGIAGGVEGGRSGYGEFDGKHIADVIGKDIGKQIVDESHGELSGEGLKIGGSGQKGFYDKELVNLANDLVKKWGVKVRDIPLDTPETKNRYKADGDVVIDIQTNKVVDRGDSYPEATDLAEQWNQENRAEAQPAKSNIVHSIPITDSMRRDILEKGQPLFQPQSNVQPQAQSKTKSIPPISQPDQDKKKQTVKTFAEL